MMVQIQKSSQFLIKSCCALLEQAASSEPPGAIQVATLAAEGQWSC